METISQPHQCPACGGQVRTEITADGPIYWCDHLYCAGRLKALLHYAASEPVLALDALDDAMADRLVEDRYIVTLADLFRFEQEVLQHEAAFSSNQFVRNMALSGFAPAAVLMLARSLVRARTRPWHRWIAALNIPGVGPQVAEPLARVLRLDAESMAVLPARLLLLRDQGVEGIGAARRDAILRTARSPAFQDLCQALYQAGVRPAAVNTQVEGAGALESMVVVITGDFLAIGSREYLTSRLRSLGAIVKTTVSRKVTHLLVGDEAGPMKLQKARELGITMLDQEWLESILTQYGIPRSETGLTVEAV